MALNFILLYIMEWNEIDFQVQMAKLLWVCEVKVEGVISNAPPKSNTNACLMFPYWEYIFDHLNVTGAKAGADLGGKGDGFGRIRG